jgi:hypothetical protein
MRILICLTCKSLEELPDFDGPAEYDVLLEGLIDRHKFDNADRTPHLGNLIAIDKKDWEDKKKREEILVQIKTALAGGTTGFDPEFYASKNTYQADAMACFNSHKRPAAGCIDWHNDDKRIGNPTKVGWQIGPKIYQCDFCPVRAWVDKKKQDAGV